MRASTCVQRRLSDHGGFASRSTERDALLDQTTAILTPCSDKTSDGTAIGTTVKACTSDTTFRTATENCRLSSAKTVPMPTQLEYFFRGACRDNGVWTSAPSAGDAGVDGG